MGDFGKGLKNFKDQMKSNNDDKKTEIEGDKMKKAAKPKKRKTTKKS